MTLKLRQRLRNGALLLSLLLFPLTLNYMSPYLIVEGAAFGFLSGSAVLFVAMFVWSLVVGRLWCGWVCPGAGLMEALFGLQPRRMRSPRAGVVKWIIWVPWIAAITWLFVRAGGPSAVNVFHRIESGVSVESPIDFVKFYGVVVLFIIPSLVLGKRGGCHSLCWMSPFMIIGTRLSRFARIPHLHLEPTPASCGKCKTCESRCPMSLDVPAMVASGSMFNTECILCGSCVDGCPKSAIQYAFGSPSRSSQG